MPERKFNDEEKEALERETKALREFLGVTEPVRRDDEWAPPVDRDLILKLVRRELPENEARGVYKLIQLFQVWNDAHQVVLISEFHRKREMM